MLLLTRRILLTVTIALVLAVAPAQAQTTLRYQFKEGQQTKWIAEHKITMSWDMEGKAMKGTMTQILDVEQKVLGLNADGTAKVAQRITRWRFDLDSADAKVKWDTDELLQGPLFQRLVVGEFFTMNINPQGELSNIKASGKLAEMAKADPVPNAEVALFELVLKDLMGLNTLTFPKDALAKGQAWTTKAITEIPDAPFGKMEMTSTNTYQGTMKNKDKDLEHIGVSKNWQFLPQKDGLQAKITNQQSQGSLLFDNAVGQIVNMQVSQTMTMQAEGKGKSTSMRSELTTTLKPRP